ncbi:MAG: bac 5 protein [Dehalococcoidia bacterium]|nr:bac 5 protein [Dehalococcoidia bacterium]
MRLRYIRTLVTLGIVLMVALGCERGTSPTPTLTQTTTPTPVPSATPLPSPTPTTRSGELNLVIPVAAPHWDVHLTPSPVLAAWGPGIVYSRLLRFRSGPDTATPTMSTECDLCESWQQLDSTTYLFHLRRDVLWQDIPPVSGRGLVAQDIAFSYQRQGNPSYPNAPLLNSIQRVEAVDEYTLRITLKAPDADFPANLASGLSKIVAPEAVNLNGNLREGPNIGTGPWLWDGTREGQGYFFKANPSYFERGLPHLERLNVYVIADELTRIAAFRLKRIDLMEAPTGGLSGLKSNHPEIGSLLYREAGSGIEIALKSLSPPLDNLQVRKAFFSALDPWDAIDTIWGGFGFVSLGMPVADPGWLLPQEELRSYLANPDSSKELFASVPGELPLSLTLAVADYGDTYLAYGQRLAQELEAVGFTVSLKTVNPTEYPQEVWYGGRYSAFVGPIAPMTTPNMYLLSVLHSRGAWNTHSYRDPTLDSLIEEQATTLDPSRRRDLVLEIQRYAMDKAVRFMPVTRVSAWVWWPQVKEFYPNLTSSEYFHLAKLRLEP